MTDECHSGRTFFGNTFSLEIIQLHNHRLSHIHQRDERRVNSITLSSWWTVSLMNHEEKGLMDQSSTEKKFSFHLSVSEVPEPRSQVNLGHNYKVTCGRAQSPRAFSNFLAQKAETWLSFSRHKSQAFNDLAFCPAYLVSFSLTKCINVLIKTF